ncbi:uncharacterized protein RSE6_06239 [Rhynchosporium secalis]|uniref:BHLH domain-containing protein n=1 Tax=Rhynchosporium secalis TaxID=38038 RepID=A0A1E1M9V1_RHYSE|nr:uncharacterized protein RSE6_06239 [Rhynchosporium secalis]
MPSRSLSFHQAENDSIIITSRGLINSNTNVLDKAFNVGLELDEFDDWMKWENSTTDLQPFSTGNAGNMDSNVSSPDTWAMGLESSGIDMMSASYTAASEFPLVGAPFEFEDTPRTSVSSMTQQVVSPLYLASCTTQNQQLDNRRLYRGFSSLSEAEERNLQEIAMPYHALPRVKIDSVPVSPTESHESVSPSPEPEPEVRTRKNNKRKSIDLGEQPSNAVGQSKKRGHNAIEKRYRTNLNAKIESLREGVPSLCGPSSNGGEEESDGEGDGRCGQKYGKAAILMRALEYIQHLEKTTQRLGSEVDTLKTRVGAFEKLAMSGSLNGNSMEMISRPISTRRETLESIQSDFQQIPPKPKIVSGSAGRRRSSKQTKS